ncbi:hypothetical protein Neosp_015201 [[Neocosmospora] mangrovei]
MRQSPVLEWLDTLELPSGGYSLAPAHETIERSAKRAKISHEPYTSRLPTPTESETHTLGLALNDRNAHGMESPASSSSKKRRRDEESDMASQHELLDGITGNPLDLTPRASQLGSRLFRDQYHVEEPDLTSNLSRASSSISHHSSASQRSSVSGQSSPSKQARNAELQKTGFKPVSFSLQQDQQPLSLKAIRQGLTRISHGEKLFPDTLRGQLADTDIPDSSFYSTNGAPRKGWNYPPPSLVQDTLERAAQCLDEREGESSWNLEVHAPLLAWVFRRESQKPLIDYRYCTSAQIIHTFKPKNAPSKMVDFCIIVRPGEDTEEQDMIENLCYNRPGQTINHTGWGNLCKDPVAMSIETKRHGENWDTAVLQLGTWHSAQWRSLDWGRSKRVSIDFLPGIIIQGHDWLFVATIMRNDKAIMYHSISIGDTKTVLGIYKLVISLQYLQQWIEQTYWPAFRAEVLGMDEQVNSTI